MNKEAAEDAKIPLKGLAIGNGLTNTEIQYTAYPDMALDGGKSEGGSLKEGVITNQYGKFYIINYTMGPGYEEILFLSKTKAYCAMLKFHFMMICLYYHPIYFLNSSSHYESCCTSLHFANPRM